MYKKIERALSLGCVVQEEGASLSIYSDTADNMVLEIYEQDNYDEPVHYMTLNREQYAKENVFCIYLKDLKIGMGYIWRSKDDKGSFSQAIMDPYTFAIKKNKKNEYCNIVYRPNLPMTTRLHIPWKDTIIYEMHVGHFTKDTTSAIPEQERGTFKGIIKKIPYLKSLGVTAVELLPVFKWNPFTIQNKNPYTGEALQDVWGYNTIGFFAVDEKYSVSKDSVKAIEEFKSLVSCAHEAGIEVLLDVVYNHTGEGGIDGKWFNYKYLSPKTYYKFDEQGHYRNCSGTGNTFNTNHPIVKNLILDSLRYWVSYMGVDGFRFDLASILGQDEEGRWMKKSLLNEIAEDPLLSEVKLITESWDAKGSYDVGRMPYPFREWSDYFRDTMRKFVKGDQGVIKSFADCMVGKEIYFADTHKGNTHTIHFLTAHDGFTLWDLMSYNSKHNYENGEQNRDGNNANYSYNWGVEGETNDLAILRQRKKCMKNAMCFLLLSRGVPMVLMGDEIGRSQHGNNNAFCQDHKGIWMDWDREEKSKELYAFTKELITLRKSLNYFCVQAISSQITWHGVNYYYPDWSYYSRSIAWEVQSEGEKLYFIANSYYEALTFQLPPTQTKWLRLIDTDRTISGDICIEGEIIAGTSYTTAGYSFCLFKEQKKL